FVQLSVVIDMNRRRRWCALKCVLARHIMPVRLRTGKNRSKAIRANQRLELSIELYPPYPRYPRFNRSSFFREISLDPVGAVGRLGKFFENFPPLTELPPSDETFFQTSSQKLRRTMAKARNDMRSDSSGTTL